MFPKSFVFPDCSTIGWVAPRHVTRTPRIDVGAARCCQGHLMFSPALWGVSKLITITPTVLLYQSSQIPVTLNASRDDILGYYTYLNLTHLSLHSISSQTLLEGPNNWNTFCWYILSVCTQLWTVFLFIPHLITGLSLLCFTFLLLFCSACTLLIGLFFSCVVQFPIHYPIPSSTFAYL